jgi:hypothetical protein
MSLRIPLVAADGAKSSISLPDPVYAPRVIGGILFGAAVGTDTGGAGDDLPEFNRVNALLGGKFKVRRSYCSTTEAMVPAQPAGVIPFRSMKPDPASVINGSQDGLLTSWINSAPTGAYLTIQHEADNPSKGISATQFDAMFNHFAALAKSLRPDVKIGPVMMEYQIRTANGYAYCKTINPALIDFWGVDTYSDYDKPFRTFAQCCTESALPYFNGIAAGKPLLVGETGVHATAQHAGNGYTVGQTIDRARWVSDMVTWSAANNVVPLYYDVNTSTNAWKLSDAEWSRFMSLPRWSPPAQTAPSVYTVNGTFLAITAGPNEDVIVYGRAASANPSSVTVTGGRHVRFVGGKYAKSSVGATLRATRVTGSISFEGIEIDASGYNGDAINACGVSTGSLTYPDVYIQKCRVTGVNGTSSTTHADIFQAQGPIGHLYVDLFTGATTYQGFFIPPQSAISGASICRSNFTKVPNPSNPVTYMLWFNDCTQAPYSVTLDQVYVSLPSGQDIPTDGVWPKKGSVGTASTLNGKPIGAVDDGAGNASWPPVMQISGTVYAGPPPAGDFVPAGSVGIGYAP